jgi:hypothetical protein
LVIEHNKRVIAELRTIEEMLMCYDTDREIIEILKIPTSTFYRYKSRIIKDHAERFNQKKFSEVGFYSQQLHDRLTGYLKILEPKLRDNCSPRDTAAIVQIMVDISRAIFDLNLQGLEILDTIRALDRKMNTYEIKHDDVKELTCNDSSDEKDNKEA